MNISHKKWEFILAPLHRLLLSSLIAVSVAVLSTGCSTLSGVQGPHAEKIQDNIDSFRVTDTEPPATKDPELENIPEELKPLVNKWLEYFQGRGRPHMERYLSRSTRYSRLMKRILREKGVPEDLIYIALIESGFSFKATSHASAVGYWQFIRGTGKRYGLAINSMVDERRDPILSTHAAAEYFKGLYSMFGSWHLAMASYNVGEGRVKKGVLRHKTRSFYELAKKRSFPKETINYVPKYLAAKLIGENPAMYGFTEIDYLPALEFEHISVDKSVNLRVMAEKMNLEYDELKQLNPKYRGEIAPAKDNKLELRIPIGQTSVALAAALESAVEKAEFVADAGETDLHKVKRGESLYTIARRYRTTVGWLKEVNDLQPRRPLRIGQRLQVPISPTKSTAGFITAKKAPTKVNTKVLLAEKEADKTDEVKAETNPEVVTKSGVFYVVQKGDTLSAIAEDYGSSVEELRRMNKLSRRGMIKVGMKLKVPKDEGLPTSPDSNNSASTMEADSGKKSPTRVATAAKTKATRGIASTKQVPTEAKKASAKSAKKIHVVRRGENLTVIAKKYQVSLVDLKEKNKLSKGAKIMVGSRLHIPQSDNN